MLKAADALETLQTGQPVTKSSYRLVNEKKDHRRTSSYVLALCQSSKLRFIRLNSVTADEHVAYGYHLWVYRSPLSMSLRTLILLPLPLSQQEAGLLGKALSQNEVLEKLYIGQTKDWARQQDMAFLTVLEQCRKLKQLVCRDTSYVSSYAIARALKEKYGARHEEVGESIVCFVFELFQHNCMRILRPDSFLVIYKHFLSTAEKMRGVEQLCMQDIRVCSVLSRDQADYLYHLAPSLKLHMTYTALLSEACKQL